MTTTDGHHSTVQRTTEADSGTRGVAAGVFFVNAARSTGDFYWVDLPGGSRLQLSRMWLECK